MKIDILNSAQVRRFAHELVDASVKADNDALDSAVADLDAGNDPEYIATVERAIVEKYARLHDPKRIQDLYERVEHCVQGAIERQPHPVLPPPPGPPPPKPTAKNTEEWEKLALGFLLPVIGWFIMAEKVRESQSIYYEQYEKWLKDLEAKADEWSQHHATVKSLVEGALQRALAEGVEDAQRELSRG